MAARARERARTRPPERESVIRVMDLFRINAHLLRGFGESEQRGPRPRPHRPERTMTESSARGETPEASCLDLTSDVTDGHLSELPHGGLERAGLTYLPDPACQRL